jgi:hypothetical protein
VASEKVQLGAFDPKCLLLAGCGRFALPDRRSSVNGTQEWEGAVNQKQHKRLFAMCQCAKVKFEAAGPPILTASCYCTSCQEAGRQFEQLASAPSSKFRNRFPTGAPPLEMRVMTKKRRIGVELGDDMPNYGGHSGKFMLKLITAWVAMGFRRPEINLGKTVQRAQ